jgi:hypothetical protein
MNPSLRDWLRAYPKTDNSVPIQERTFQSAAAHTNAPGSDELDQRPAKQQWHVMDGQADVLWTRLR